jgi:hypothetical protein
MEWEAMADLLSVFFWQHQVSDEELIAWLLKAGRRRTRWL